MEPSNLRNARGVEASVNDLVVTRLVEAFQMRNFQGTHGLDRRTEHFVSAAAFPQDLSRGTQDSQDLRPIKPLPFTMLAEAHTVLLPRLIR